MIIYMMAAIFSQGLRQEWKESNVIGHEKAWSWSGRPCWSTFEAWQAVCTILGRGQIGISVWCFCSANNFSSRAHRFFRLNFSDWNPEWLASFTLSGLKSSEWKVKRPLRPCCKVCLDLGRAAATVKLALILMQLQLLEPGWRCGHQWHGLGKIAAAALCAVVWMSLHHQVLWGLLLPLMASVRFKTFSGYHLTWCQRCQMSLARREFFGHWADCKTLHSPLCSVDVAFVRFGWRHWQAKQVSRSIWGQLWIGSLQPNQCCHLDGPSDAFLGTSWTRWKVSNTARRSLHAKLWPQHAIALTTRSNAARLCSSSHLAQDLTFWWLGHAVHHGLHLEMEPALMTLAMNLTRCSTQIKCTVFFVFFRGGAKTCFFFQSPIKSLQGVAGKSAQISTRCADLRKRWALSRGVVGWCIVWPLRHAAGKAEPTRCVFCPYGKASAVLASLEEVDLCLGWPWDFWIMARGYGGCCDSQGDHECQYLRCRSRWQFHQEDDNQWKKTLQTVLGVVQRTQA